MTQRVLIWLLSVVFAGLSCAQGVVTLRPVARLDADAPITLADVALLTGSAETLAGAVLVENPAEHAGASKRLEIQLEDVRTALSGDPAFRAGRLALRGESCRVILRVKAPEPLGEALARSPLHIASVGPTLRDHIEARLVETLGVPRERLQLAYDARDAVLLSHATAGWTVDVQPVGASEAMPLRITMYDADGNIRDESVRVGVRILREVVRTTRAMRRGEGFTPADLARDTAWLAPDVPYIDAEAANTVRLRRSIGAGEMLTSAHAEQAEVIGKGEIVAVHVLSGTIVMRSQARALSAGRIGETIEFEPLTGGGRFSAEVKAPGRAVAIAGATPLSGIQP